MKQKKKIDFEKHNIKCEEAANKSINMQFDEYQIKFSKYMKKIVNHKLNQEKVRKYSSILIFRGTDLIE